MLLLCGFEYRGPGSVAESRKYYLLLHVAPTLSRCITLRYSQNWESPGVQYDILLLRVKHYIEDIMAR